MKLCTFNSTMCGHFSLSRLLIRKRASLDPRPAEVQILRRLYNTAHTQVRPRETSPEYTGIWLNSEIKCQINCNKFQVLSLTSYIARHVQALRKKLKSAIMKHDIPLIVRGHDASISKGSIKAAVRWVQDSHTSAVSQATKSYCGLRTKSCPSSCANLK